MSATRSTTLSTLTASVSNSEKNPSFSYLNPFILKSIVLVLYHAI